MRLLNAPDIESFVMAKPAAAIHFDADWDKTYRTIVSRKMADAEAVLGRQVNFGEVDCDSNPEVARSIPVLNVPLVAYYRHGKLVASLIGAEQNVQVVLEQVLRGEEIQATTPSSP